MSTIRDPAYITDAGRTMMTAGGDVTYTKAVLYGQDISHLTSDQVKALTTIGSPLREVKVGISDKQNTDRGTTVILEATFQNDNLANDLPYTAVGFFAKRGDDAEKLVILGVANSGAYLAAASPDGVASDALDVKVAIAIGDATSVTAVVDPAGSVTPATLNGAINKAKQELIAQIGVKANADDVYTKKQVDDAVATKADKATVDNEISKIDFTPYAKEADLISGFSSLNDAFSELNEALTTSHSDITALQSKVTSQAQEIQSLKAQLNDVVNQINYIKANYIEGKSFAKSDEAKADAWEKENSQHLAFILDN